MEPNSAVAGGGGTGGTQTPEEHPPQVATPPEDHKCVGDSLDSPTLVGFLRAQLPAFACGAATFWMLQSMLCGNLQDEQAVAGCVGVQHMVDALHAEVDVSRRLLAECRQELRLVQVTLDRVPKSLRDALAQIPQSRTASVSAHVAGVTNSASSNRGTPSGEAQHIGSSISSVATDHEAAGRRLQLLSGVQERTPAAVPFYLGCFLCLLDAGLLYFCLRQLLPQHSQDSLGHQLASALSRLRLLQQETGKGSGTKDGRNNDNQPPQLSLVDPSGGHMLIRRPERATTFQRPAEEATTARGAGAQQSRWATTSLALASVVGAMATRLLLLVVAASRFSFLSHALTYSVVTFRVCLIVLLVLF